MDKYKNTKLESTILNFIEEYDRDFWEKHKLIETKYYVSRKEYKKYDSEYDRWVSVFPAVDLYGPYESEEEARDDLERLLGDVLLTGLEFYVRTAKLVEKLEPVRFWI